MRTTLVVKCRKGLPFTLKDYPIRSTGPVGGDRDRVYHRFWSDQSEVTMFASRITLEGLVQVTCHTSEPVCRRLLALLRLPVSGRRRNWLDRIHACAC